MYESIESSAADVNVPAPIQTDLELLPEPSMRGHAEDGDEDVLVGGHEHFFHLEVLDTVGRGQHVRAGQQRTRAVRIKPSAFAEPES